MDIMAKSVKNDKVQWSHHGDCKLNLKNVSLKLSEDSVIMTLSHNARLGTDKNKPQEFLRGSFTPSSTHRVSSEAVSWKQTKYTAMTWLLTLLTSLQTTTTHHTQGSCAHTHLPTAGELKSAQHRPHHPPVLRGTCHWNGRLSRARTILCSAAQGKEGTRKD